MQHVVREIYAFPSGRMLPEHCAAFAAALSALWPEPSWPAAVVFEPRGEPTLSPGELGARAYDASAAQAVLSYASARDLFPQLRPLFLNADPELFFQHRDGFEQVIALVPPYAEREQQAHKARGADAWLARIGASELCARYAPLVVHRPDGRCFALEQAPPRSAGAVPVS